MNKPLEFNAIVTLNLPEFNEPMTLHYETAEEAVIKAEGFKAEGCTKVTVYVWTEEQGSYIETAF